MSVSKPCSTPFASSSSSDDQSPALRMLSYTEAQLVTLQYATITRPDIVFAVNSACQHMQAPSEENWAVVKRILRYLQGIVSFGLHFKRSFSLQLQAFSDADWAGDLTDRISTSGMAIFIGLSLISWMKHIEIAFHFVRELVAAKCLEVRFLSTTEKIDDILTKGLSITRFHHLRLKLSISEPP
ncbi:uncharacterized protein LOC113345747 [Papaver somniferum]|uniref:uncharacterized protein LOC113345747 n=1 Tax=Papaver somniferum TaxID=3469 RepID=UPI000E701C0A|nr:uncharacterized protein LOC113345747 [Papaver somniferum]